MSVARSSGVRASALLSNADGSFSNAALPSARTFSYVRIPPNGTSSRTTTCFSPGQLALASRTFEAWSWVEAKATTVPLSLRR